MKNLEEQGRALLDMFEDHVIADGMVGKDAVVLQHHFGALLRQGQPVDLFLNVVDPFSKRGFP